MLYPTCSRHSGLGLHHNDAAVAPALRAVSWYACACLQCLTQVEGCQRLLKEEKPYYQRFCVCEDHMRSLAITVDGVLSRFCQQCAKFEPVEAFDGSKRWVTLPRLLCWCTRPALIHGQNYIPKLAPLRCCSMVSLGGLQHFGCGLLPGEPLCVHM